MKCSRCGRRLKSWAIIAGKPYGPTCARLYAKVRVQAATEHTGQEDWVNESRQGDQQRQGEAQGIQGSQGDRPVMPEPWELPPLPEKPQAQAGARPTDAAITRCRDVRLGIIHDTAPQPDGHNTQNTGE